MSAWVRYRGRECDEVFFELVVDNTAWCRNYAHKANGCQSVAREVIRRRSSDSDVEASSFVFGRNVSVVIFYWLD